MQAAAQTYFAKGAKDLTLPEAALIAGLPQAPSEYNPLQSPQAALQRRNEVLQALQQQGYINRKDYESALQSGLGLDQGYKYQQVKQPYFFDYVQQQLIDKYGVNTVRSGGLKVYTTINSALQADAQNAVDSCSVCYSGGGPAGGARLGRRHERPHPCDGLLHAVLGQLPVQLRGRRPPPARVLVQALRARDRAAAGNEPRHHLLLRQEPDDAHA